LWNRYRITVGGASGNIDSADANQGAAESEKGANNEKSKKISDHLVTRGYLVAFPIYIFRCRY
jgi:hypothetical protein